MSHQELLLLEKNKLEYHGNNILGTDSVYNSTTNTSILSVFGYQVAKTRSFRTKINGTWNRLLYRNSNGKNI